MELAAGKLILLRRIMHLSVAGHQLTIALHFRPILATHHQKAKTLAIILAQVLVVHLVCPTNGTHINVVASGKPLQALVDDYIVNQKIGRPVEHDPKSDGL